MATKLYSDSARQTTLASGISGGAATMTLADATGWPSPSAGQEANVAVDYGDQSLVEVGTYTSRSGNVLSGVTGISNGHSSGAKVWHVISAVDAAKGANAATTTLVRKTAAESVTSSIAVQDDDHLTLAVAANEVWEIQLVLVFETGAAAGDAKTNVSIPAGASIKGMATGLTEPATGTSNVQLLAVTSGGDEFVWGTSPSFYSVVKYQATVVVGATAGNVKLRWAQGTSSATATVLSANSYLIARKVS